MNIIRLVTIHPTVVHLTLGGIPLLILAYAVARWRRSARWAFAGDVALAFTIVAALLTAIFGFVSNAVLVWPGGVEVWRWTHLGAAVLTVLLLLGLGVRRIDEWRHQRPVRGLPLAILIGIVGAFTGWAGGEVLVYRSGMAVEAAGQGAFSPPLKGERHRQDLAGVMGELRASWAGAATPARVSFVEQPSTARFGMTSSAALRLATYANWLATQAKLAKQRPEAAAMARILVQQAVTLQQGAHARNLAALLSTLSQVETTCTRCHEAFRWQQK